VAGDADDADADDVRQDAAFAAEERRIVRVAIRRLTADTDTDSDVADVTN